MPPAWARDPARPHEDRPGTWAGSAGKEQLFLFLAVKLEGCRPGAPTWRPAEKEADMEGSGPEQDGPAPAQPWSRHTWSETALRLPSDMASKWPVFSRRLDGGFCCLQRSRPE